MESLRGRGDGAGNKINETFKKELNSLLILLATRCKHLEDVNKLLQQKVTIRDDQLKGTQEASTQHSDFLE